jgi:hypothetical protein
MPESASGPDVGYPPPILPWSKEKIDRLKTFLDERIREIEATLAEKHDEFADYEEAYRARPEQGKTMPFVGADPTTVGAIAMAVDPIHSRLDTGIFKQAPVFTFQALKKSINPYIDSLQKWVEFYQKHRLHLRTVSSPRLLELAKLGTCVFKTVYHREQVKTKTYDENFKVVDREITRFSGPKVFGVAASDLMFDSGYQHLQMCPMVIERQRTTYAALYGAQLSGQLKNVEELRGRETVDRSVVEDERAEMTKHSPGSEPHDIVVYEIWFDYFEDEDPVDIRGSSGTPVKLVATYEKDTRTLLQLRYHWYFHQRWPYTVIPYMVTSDSILGLGIGEMVKPFQDIITRFQRMVSDNAYLANIRMFIAKKDSGIEDVPRLFAGRTFFVDDPSKDFIPFAAAEIYPSTIQERQNLFGLVEKRTGVSDYLTGRESPIIGTRATATSTLALIKEGLARVEEVMENIRLGLAEVMENCVYIWIQYGLGDIKDLVFGDDEVAADLDKLFSTLSQENVGGALAISLSATDSTTAPQAMQQMQLQVIQVMMQYLEKVLEAGQAALMAQQQGMPQLTEMIKEVMRAARQMFHDLLNKYDIPNADDYLPDLEQFLQGGPLGSVAGGPGGVAGAQGGAGGFEAQRGLSVLGPNNPGQMFPRPATPGQGGGAASALPPTGPAGGVPG